MAAGSRARICRPSCTATQRGAFAARRCPEALAARAARVLMPRPARLRAVLVRLPALAGALTPLWVQGERDLLQRVGAAIGAPDPDPTACVVLQGDADFHGTACSFRLTFDGRGAFLHEIRGPVGETIGSDGQRTWLIDRTGAPRLLFFEDADKGHAVADLLSDHWLDDLDLTRAVDGDELRVTLPSGMSVRIQIDPATQLPSRATFDLHAGPVVVV